MAAEPDPTTAAIKQPPTIGLVLSGGGARGIAHVGVFKALEEMNIKVSAVAGTSAGSIIGGLYASGLSADEVAEKVKHIDWNGGFSDDADRQDLPMRRKQDDYKNLIKYRISIKDGEMRLPKGVVQGQQLNLILKDLFKDVEDIRDFDQLPIPFRAVSADITTGEAYVFKGGSLATATRASMSIPGVYSPVEYDGHLLVDGGIAANLPVEIVQNMGVDQVIVVDISTPLGTEEDLDSFLAMSGQVLTILTQRNTVEQINKMKPGDVLIQPDLDEVTTFSFDKTELAIQRGYDATMALQSELAAFVSPQPNQMVIKTDLVPIIGFIDVDNNSDISDELVLARIEQPLNKSFDRALVMENIAAIYSLDYFEIVDYDLITRDGETGLLITTKERSWGSDYLRLGFNFSDDFNGRSSFNIATSYRQKGVNKLGAEWYVFGQLGSTMEFTTNLYQPLDYHTSYYIEPYFHYKGEHVYQQLASVRNRNIERDWWVSRTTVGFDLGKTILSDIDLRIGLFYTDGDYELKDANQDYSEDSFVDTGYRVALAYDSVDNIHFPTRGYYLGLVMADNSMSMGADYAVTHYQANVAGIWSLGKHTLQSSLLAETFDNAPKEPQYRASLGGLRHLSGYSSGAISGQHSFLARLQYSYRLTARTLLPFDFPAYLGATLEAGNVWEAKSEADIDDLINAGSIFIGFDSPLGPMYLGYGASDDEQRAVYISIGESF
jgi:NTE family protein